ncbi:hypothetical protein FHR81_000191 [Actinoalloteichus hoggarensis]|uniref:Uncharacterized protein n=1 Tax=Actinoalloteichus hoggarensis TaxID=1470176 RepID=A0A221W2X0_9PSEU|nr:hypothetical protein [Actinoalloteichus hoggarensis]ASO20125.1 hypothetical protein AHOG_12410 [Actinoalloteichus hoggarensis]MBB5919162.1 hypothetical protein [Actinoalloteichus hoggarensis]
MYAWFVRSVRAGDTHLAEEDWDGYNLVTPVCESTVAFSPLNREPIEVCYFDEQRCLRCLEATRPRPKARLAAVR